MDTFKIQINFITKNEEPMEDHSNAQAPREGLLDKAEKAMEDVTKKATVVWEKVEDKAGEMWENREEIMGDIKEKAKDIAGDVEEGAKKLWDKVMDKLEPEGAEEIKEEKKEV